MKITGPCVRWLALAALAVTAFVAWRSIEWTDHERQTDSFKLAAPTKLPELAPIMFPFVWKCPAPVEPLDNRPPPEFWSQSREDEFLLEHFFRHPLVTHGFFVELGAFDGVWGSNTKFYEDRLDWRGILIEAHPESFQTLSARRPKSAKFPTAICKEPGAVTMVGKPDAVASADETMAPGFREKWHGGQGEARHRVRCTELHRILAVVGVRKIDFFSLDVEGAELQVLKTMDWTIPVRVWVVENDDHNPTKNAEVDAILAKHGYVKTNLRTCERGTVNCMPNDIYVHPDWETATRSLTHEDLYTNFGTTAC